jgi:FMN phosphatase YigB (HAD superfamily)
MKIEAVLFDFSGVVANVRPTFIGDGHSEGDHFVFVANDQVVSSIQRLRSAGLQTGLVTNNERSLLSAMNVAIETDQHFDSVVFPDDCGAAKPSSRIFQYAAQQLGVLPEKCAFVDDVARNVDAAESIGMTGHVYDGIDRFTAFVEELLQPKRTNP